MKDLEKSLGKALTAKELADYLGVTEKTIRENYRQFGGIKVGRHYRFFTREVAKYALEKRQTEICSTDQEERETEGACLSDPEGSKKVGIGNAQDVRRRMERDDKHNLLD